MTGKTRHPHHDDVVAQIRSHYRESFPELGYLCDEGALAWFQRFPNGGGAVTLKPIEPGQVPGVVEEIRARYASPVSIYVDDRAQDERLAPALAAVGWQRATANVWLAHVGDIPPVRDVAGLTVERSVAPDELRLWSVVKLKGFDDSEDEPDPARLDNEMKLRLAEVADGTRFLLGRIDGEPATILGAYVDESLRSVFLLATRVDFRHRRIATRMLLDEARDARAAGCPCTNINADEDGRAVRLYRRLRFVDEVYWRRTYTPPA